ncbi:MAG: SPOR domain-containing protein [Hyphomicrobiaceae bacterium]|nr:SPOR domain-containing protein [Hyphomicrobiaceae bacterium]
MPLKANAADRLAAPAAPSGSMWRIYVAGWVLLGTTAASYIGLAVVKPSLIQQFAPVAAPNGGGARSEKLAAEVETLRSTVGRLQAELTGIKTRVAEQSRKTAAVNPPGNTAGNEQPADVPSERSPLIRVGKVRTINPTANPPAATDSPPPPVASAPAPVKPARVAGRMPPLPTRVERPPRPVGPAKPPQRVAQGPRPRVINQDGDGTPPATTGSIPVPPKPPAARPEPQTATPPKVNSPPKITFGAPIVRPATSRDLTPTLPPPIADNSAAITLSRASTIDGLRVSWQALANKHPTLLGGLQPRYAREAGGTFRLLAGPFGDRAAADRLCSALRIDNVPCGIGKFTGNAL